MEKENTKAVKLPRGLRNNNPLNIRITPAQRQGKDRWLGMCKEQTDKAFCQFTDMKWGWRAAFLLLTRNYYMVHHLYTPKDIIMRWAPPSDGNNTEAYIKFVCEKAGLQPDQYLGVPSSAEGLTWMKLALAMAIMENGITQKYGVVKYNLEFLDYLAMMDGWMLARDYAQRHVASEKNR